MVAPGAQARPPRARATEALKRAARAALDRVPLLPVPVTLQGARAPSVRFWWSRLTPDFDFTRAGLRYRGPERADLLFMARYLRPGMHYLDVGAYHGLYAVVAGRRIGDAGSVTLFEPSPTARRRARLHMALNGLSARLLRQAVTDRCGRCAYYVVTSGFATMSGLRPHPDARRVRELAVEAVTLDAHVRADGVERLDLLKVDVEGGELALLGGARRLLATLRPVILCEVLDWVTAPWGYRARAIVDALAAHGYRWFDVVEDGRLRPHRVAGSYPEIRNYVAVPAERVARVVADVAAGEAEDG